MARETVTIYRSDISGDTIEDESNAVEVRIRFLGDSRRKPVVLDALVSEVQELITKGREVNPPGRKRKTK
jgi:hypothetical protein